MHRENKQTTSKHWLQKIYKSNVHATVISTENILNSVQTLFLPQKVWEKYMFFSAIHILASVSSSNYLIIENTQTST